MFCESCQRRPGTMRMTVRRPDGEQRVILLCGLCAYRFQQMMAPGVAARGGGQAQLPGDTYSGQHFPTQRHGMFSGYSQATQQVLKTAEKISADFGLPSVGTMPLLMGILSLRGQSAARLLETRGVSLEDVAQSAPMPAAMPAKAPSGQVRLSADSQTLLDMAQNLAVGHSGAFVEPDHLLLAMLQHENMSATRWMRQRSVDIDALKTDLENAVQQADAESTPQITEASPEEMLMGPSAAGGASGKPGTGNALQQYASDLTEQARMGKLMPAIGREAEMGRVELTLCRLQKNNPLLIGEAGVGKTAIVEGLAQHIVKGDVPDPLKDCTLYQVDLTGMVAGTEMRGEFESRVKDLVDQVVARGPKTILFIDEIHTLVGAGASEGSMDAGNILKPALARGQLHLIGATTIDEFHKYIEKDPALARRFQPVLVGEPTVEQSITILNGIKERFEKHHGVTLSPEAISAAVTLSNQYMTDRFLPDKAVDLVDEACSAVAIENDQEGQGRAVIADDVAKAVSSWTGIPLAKMIEPEKKRLLEMENLLHRRIVNQDAAVRAVSDVVRRSRAGLKDPEKPNGAFVFAGPTGVGKTELARTLAWFLFDDADALVRLDMSEYMEKESVSRLIGAAPGYVGYEEGGQLTEKVRTRPYSVVLFDEMEKAHPQVLNLLLQIADAGRLTDGQGREVNFKNTIIILTTNLGAELFSGGAAAAMDHEALTAKVTELVIAHTSPELVNRMDAVVVFESLSREQVEKVIEIQLEGLSRRLAGQGIALEVSQEAMGWLADRGYDPEMGARPAKRVVQDQLVSPLSEMILSGTLASGSRAVVSLSGDVLAIGHATA
ncbi:MAG: ATP-dependent Clp protease ATP-binding subunit [Actinomycetota bacterium]